MTKHAQKPTPKKHHEHPGKDHGHPLEPLNGRVLAQNFSPKGGVEGLLIDKAGQTVQVNLPPDAWPSIAPGSTIGEAVHWLVVPEPKTEKHPEADHPVYRFVSIEAGEGESLEDQANASGVVARLNYARHGEPNGVVLDNGDFVHLRPEGMKKLGLVLGQEVLAEGKARPMVLGHRVIEAEVVNGLAIGPKPPRD